MESSINIKEYLEELRVRAEKSLLEDGKVLLEDNRILSAEEIQKKIHDLKVHQIELEMQNEELRTSKIEIEILSEKYFELYNMAPVGYLTINENGQIHDANLTASAMFGQPRRSLTKQNISMFVHKENQDIYYIFMKKLLKTGEPATCELRMTKHGVTEFWVKLDATIAPSIEGETMYHVVFSDITILKITEFELEHYRNNLETVIDKRSIELLESKKSYQLILNTISDHVYEVKINEKNTSTTIHTQACYMVTGYYDHEFANNPLLWYETIYPDDRDAVTQFINNIASMHENRSIEHRIIHKNGSIRWIKNTIVSHKNSEGVIVSYEGIIRNITDRKLVEENLIHSEEKYRLLFENDNNAIVILDSETGNILDLNNAFIDTYGFSKEESLYKNFHSLIEINPKTSCIDDYENCLNGTSQYRYLNYKKDGTEFWVETSIGIFTWMNRKCFFIMVRDITEKYFAEKTLRESDEKFKTIADYTNDWEAWLNEEGVLMWISPSVLRFTGYTDIECLSMTDYPYPIIMKEDRNSIREILRTSILGRKVGSNVEFRILHKTSSYRWVSMSWGSIYNNTGKYIGIRSSIHDITDRKTAEIEIVRLNRHIIKLQEEERQKVSKDLHDSVGQTILTAKLNIDTYKKDIVLYKDRLDIGISFIEKASRELREIYMNLYPSILSDLGLEATIRWLSKNAMESNGIVIKTRINLEVKLSHKLNVCLYRVIQELFSNILKHSKAGNVELILSANEHQVKLNVIDNGIGFESKKPLSEVSCYGLMNINSRVNSFGGTMNIITNEKGTTTSIIFQQANIE